ncbi:MAG TPA: response regulator [Granulicella sp.]|jgi:two-component system chemotaxis response regulator CheY|nr:response regulator [Granulicella sp.]
MPDDLTQAHPSLSKQSEPERPPHDYPEHEQPLEHVSPFSSTTILLVDDDPDIRVLTRTFLEHIGFRVLVSGDADRAAQIFLSAPHISLLIADQNMPRRSGMDLAVQLKALRPDLPVLMISGGAIENAPKSLFTQPGWCFLPKPFSLPALLDTVHQILQTVDMQRDSDHPAPQGTASA